MISNFKFVKYKDAFDLNKFLKKKLPLKKNVFRYNFHKNNLDEDQFMLIWQRKNYYYPPKKFFDTSKTYVLLKGKIDVLILNSKGKLIKAYNLNRSKLLLQSLRRFGGPPDFGNDPPLYPILQGQ